MLRVEAPTHSLRRGAGPTIVLCGALGAALVGWPYRHAIEVARSRTYTAASVPHRSAALVFGAGIWPDGSPTPILYDRVRTAAELYAAGKVDGVVMSGAVGANGRDEPVTMARLAEAFGVPARAITLDGNGTSTFGSCAGWLADRMRRRSNEGVVLVTQAYHMPRALLACGRWDPAIVGVSADRRRYPAPWIAWWRLREWPATLKLLWRLRRHRS